MSLKDRITEDMKAAMRAKDARAPADHPHAAGRVQAARGRRAHRARRRGGRSAIVDKLIKQRKDSITAFAAGGRTDLVDKESAEIAGARGLPAAAPDADEIAAEVAAHRGRARRQRARRHGQGDGARPRRSWPARPTWRRCRPPSSRRWRSKLTRMNTTLPLHAIAADVCVAPQLTPEAMAEAARVGLSQRGQQPARLRRRPDQPTSAQIEAAAQAAGLEYRFLPVAGGYQSPEEIAAFARAAAGAAAPDPGVLPLRRTLRRACTQPALAALSARCRAARGATCLP